MSIVIQKYILSKVIKFNIVQMKKIRLNLSHSAKISGSDAEENQKKYMNHCAQMFEYMLPDIHGTV